MKCLIYLYHACVQPVNFPVSKFRLLISQKWFDNNLDQTLQRILSDGESS